MTTPQTPHYPSASAKARSVMMVLLHFHRNVDNSVVTHLPLTPRGKKLNIKETRSLNEYHGGNTFPFILLSSVCQQREWEHETSSLTAEQDL